MVLLNSWVVADMVEEHHYQGNGWSPVRWEWGSNKANIGSLVTRRTAPEDYDKVIAMYNTVIPGTADK